MLRVALALVSGLALGVALGWFVAQSSGAAAGSPGGASVADPAAPKSTTPEPAADEGALRLRPPPAKTRTDRTAQGASLPREAADEGGLFSRGLLELAVSHQAINQGI